MLEYNIELISMVQTNGKWYIAFQGWIYSDASTTLHITCKNKNLPIKEIAWEFRKDINDHFNIDDNEKRGFCLKVPYKKKDIKISFVNKSGDTKNYIQNNTLELAKKYKRTSGKVHLISPKNLKKGLKLLKDYGIKYTVKLIYLKLKPKDAIDVHEKIYNYDYSFEEVRIPQDWMIMLKIQPLFIVYIKIKEWNNHSVNSLNSIINQQFKKIKLFIKIEDDNLKEQVDSCLYDKNIEYYYSEKLKYLEELKDKNVYFMELLEGDVLATTALAHMAETINLKAKPDIIYSDYDHFEELGVYYTHISNNRLKKLNIDCILRGAWCARLDKELKSGFMDIKTYLDQYQVNKKDDGVAYINKVLLHRNINIKSSSQNNIRVIAFYLPQYHCFSENNQWWGEGFTEWRNVKRAVPMFEGHNQPRIPGELGYYNLIEEKDSQYKQMELARQYGVCGFCYYYYWFNGRRLLERPFDKMLNDPNITLPFCICWANENWTRRWDGLQSEILMEQIHEQDSDERFIKDVIDVLKDTRYISVDNKPLLLIYKINLLPNGRKTIRTWREEVKKYGIEDIYVAIVKQEGIISPEDYGANALVEFPPHNMGAKNITELLDTNKNFQGNIYDYSEMANRELEEEEYTILRGTMLQWDNTARRMEKANIFHNFSSEDYKHWLIKNKEYSNNHNNSNEQIIFINAWNEWAEGTYLEPDEKYGRLHLEITKQVVESR